MLSNDREVLCEAVSVLACLQASLSAAIAALGCGGGNREVLIGCVVLPRVHDMSV